MIDRAVSAVDELARAVEATTDIGRWGRGGRAFAAFRGGRAAAACETRAGDDPPGHFHPGHDTDIRDGAEAPTE